MVFPQIKSKEKKKSFNLKLKISKKEVEGLTLNPEEVTELKRTLLEELNYEIDNLIEMMVENEELDNVQYAAFHDSLNKVFISESLGEEVGEEVEEELETEEEN